MFVNNVGEKLWFEQEDFGIKLMMPNDEKK